jgi:hypothetical protein
MFYYRSLPSGAFSNVVESAEWALLSCFVAGLVQYSLLGYVIDLFLGRMRGRWSRKKSQ